MTATITAHLNFRGCAAQALGFYQSVFGGQLMSATYGQVGVPADSQDPERAAFMPEDPSSPDADHLAFGVLATDGGLRLAAYDIHGASGEGLAGADVPGASSRASGLTHTESSFLLLNSQTPEEARGLWAALAEGGTVVQALAPAGWAPLYGMLTDRFGVTWVFGVVPAS